MTWQTGGRTLVCNAYAIDLERGMTIMPHPLDALFSCLEPHLLRGRSSNLTERILLGKQRRLE